MATAHDVAAYILGRQGPMSAMKLQKLVYYAQAWSLAWEDRPLFRERIEAWAHGPVVPELYQAHRGQWDVRGWPRGNAAALREGDRETVDAVLDHYGGRSAQVLSDWTHAEEPWRRARAGVPDGERGNAEITLESMMEYYSGVSTPGECSVEQPPCTRPARRSGRSEGVPVRGIEMVLEKTEEVSPRRFLSLLEEGKAGDIERVAIRPPRLGERGFGRLVVERKHGAFRPSPSGTARKG